MDLSSRTAYAGAGLLATTAGIAFGHLTAAFVNPAASPVLAVGSTVIDLTPTPVKEFAVRELGNADKPVLLASVAFGTLLLAGGAGVLARRSFPLGAGLLIALVGLAGVFALIRPVASPIDALPAVVSGLVGLAVLFFIVSRLGGRREAPAPGTPEAVIASRRGLLLGAGAVAVLSGVAAATGQWVIRTGSSIANVVLPRATSRFPPCPPGSSRSTAASAR